MQLKYNSAILARKFKDMQTHKVLINPNSPGDFEENVDWDYYKNKKYEEPFEMTIHIEDNSLLDNSPTTSTESYKMEIINLSK